MKLVTRYRTQGRTLQQNSSAGIIMSNQSLVLQRIDRQTAGIYTCLATNIEGQGVSNALALPVKCKSPFFFPAFTLQKMRQIDTLPKMRQIEHKKINKNKS